MLGYQDIVFDVRKPNKTNGQSFTVNFVSNKYLDTFTESVNILNNSVKNKYRFKNFLDLNEGSKPRRHLYDEFVNKFLHDFIFKTNTVSSHYVPEKSEIIAKNYAIDSSLGNDSKKLLLTHKARIRRSVGNDISSSTKNNRPNKSRRHRHRNHHELYSETKRLKFEENSQKNVSVHRKNGPSTKGGLYTDWSKWTRCNRKCKQKRRRRCRKKAICSTAVIKEERPCSGWRCRKKPDNLNYFDEYSDRKNVRRPSSDNFNNLHIDRSKNYKKSDSKNSFMNTSSNFASRGGSKFSSELYSSIAKNSFEVNPSLSKLSGTNTAQNMHYVNKLQEIIVQPHGEGNENFYRVSLDYDMRHPSSHPAKPRYDVYPTHTHKFDRARGGAESSFISSNDVKNSVEHEPNIPNLNSKMPKGHSHLSNNIGNRNTLNMSTISQATKIEDTKIISKSNNHSKPFKVVQGRKSSQRDVRLLLNYNAMFYTRWSDWAGCSNNCLTFRYRWCRYKLFCGAAVVREEAFCYSPGDDCERKYNVIDAKSIDDYLVNSSERQTSINSLTSEKDPSISDKGIKSDYSNPYNVRISNELFSGHVDNSVNTAQSHDTWKDSYKIETQQVISSVQQPSNVAEFTREDTVLNNRSDRTAVNLPDTDHRAPFGRNRSYESTAAEDKLSDWMLEKNSILSASSSSNAYVHPASEKAPPIVVATSISSPAKILSISASSSHYPPGGVKTNQTSGNNLSFVYSHVLSPFSTTLSESLSKIGKLSQQLDSSKNSVGNGANAFAMSGVFETDLEVPEIISRTPDNSLFGTSYNIASDVVDDQHDANNDEDSLLSSFESFIHDTDYNEVDYNNYLKPVTSSEHEQIDDKFSIDRSSLSQSQIKPSLSSNSTFMPFNNHFSQFFSSFSFDQPDEDQSTHSVHNFSAVPFHDHDHVHISSSSTSLNAVCGVSKKGFWANGSSKKTGIGLSLRILGGQEAERGQWPWQVVILNRYKEAFCGGVIVGPRWVLTAAHCVRKRLYVRLAEHDLALSEGTELEFRITESVTHPLYDSTTVDNDVALLRLPRPLDYTPYLSPVCLPPQGAPLPIGQLCTIIGWGKERNTHLFGTDVLHQAQVPVIDSRQCRSVYAEYHITSNMFCAGDRGGRVDSCAGDSGGPLLCLRDNKWHVFGITSFGEGCGRRGKYGIYARVSNYYAWISDVISTDRSAGPLSTNNTSWRLLGSVRRHGGDQFHRRGILRKHPHHYRRRHKRCASHNHQRQD